jgi:pentatricopeptide repeat protein
MKMDGLEADKITLVNILDACIDEAGLAEGRRVHKHIIVSSFEADIVVGTALLNMYGKCGALEDACRVFDNHLLHRDTIAWTIMISTYAQHGRVKESLGLLKKMRDEEGIEPNEITFISVLNACSHSGLVDEGRQCFASMKECGIMPGVDHYNCMLDLLTRAGMLDEAESLINEMPITPGSVGWTTILGGCRDRFDAPRGERAAGNVLEMDPVNVLPPYVTLSNIYSGYSKDNNLVLSSEIT